MKPCAIVRTVRFIRISDSERERESDLLTVEVKALSV